MLGEKRIDGGGVHALLPIGLEAMHDDAIRLGEAGPHLAELAVAAGRDLVTGREEIADRRLESAAAGGVNREGRLRRPEDWWQELEHRRELIRELRRTMMDHGSSAGAEHALGTRVGPGVISNSGSLTRSHRSSAEGHPPRGGTARRH